jgi:hypothetical protein
LNNKDLEQAIHDLNGLAFAASQAKHIADGWPNSSYGDDARKEYESLRKRMDEIYNRYKHVAKLAEKYGDLPPELLFHLYAYDATESRQKDLLLHRDELLELGFFEYEPPIVNIDEEIAKTVTHLRELKPKTNKCLKMVEYVGLEWYDAFVEYVGGAWIGRDTTMKLIPREMAPYGEFYEPESMDIVRGEVLPYVAQINKVKREFIRYAFGPTRDSMTQYAICLVEGKNEVLVWDRQG